MTRRRERGFSLLEVLAGMSLFAIVASSVGMLATQSIRRTVENRHGTEAALLAQQEMERVREIDYTNIVSRTTSQTMNGHTFVITTGVLDDTPAASMKQITVSVGWTGPEGPHSYAISTIYTDVTA